MFKWCFCVRHNVAAFVHTKVCVCVLYVCVDAIQISKLYVLHLCVHYNALIKLLLH